MEVKPSNWMINLTVNFAERFLPFDLFDCFSNSTCCFGLELNYAYILNVLLLQHEIQGVQIINHFLYSANWWNPRIKREFRE